MILVSLGIKLTFCNCFRAFPVSSLKVSCASAIFVTLDIPKMVCGNDFEAVEQSVGRL